MGYSQTYDVASKLDLGKPIKLANSPITDKNYGMTLLALVRHAESTYNAEGIWAGQTDVPLSQKGEQDSKEMGRTLRELSPDTNWELFVTPLVRTQKTAALAIESGGLHIRGLVVVPALTERDYGKYVGLNKWEVKDQVGEEQFREIRRSFRFPIEGGESLSQVYDRVVAWYLEIAEPLLTSGVDILIVAHGNSLRALIKYIENMSDDAIADFELATGVPRIYEMTEKKLFLKS